MSYYYGRNPAANAWGSKNLDTIFGFGEGYPRHVDDGMVEQVAFFTNAEDGKQILEVYTGTVKMNNDVFGISNTLFGRIVFDENSNDIVENTVTKALQDLCQNLKDADTKSGRRNRYDSYISYVDVSGGPLALAYATEVLRLRSPYAYEAIKRENIFKAMGENDGIFAISNVLSLFIDYPNEMEKIVKISPRTLKTSWSDTIASSLVSDNKKAAVPPALLTWANKQTAPGELLSLLQTICAKEDKNNAVIMQDYVNQMKRLHMISTYYRRNISSIYDSVRQILEADAGYSSKKVMDYLFRQNYFYGDFKGPYEESAALADYVQMATTAGLDFDKFPQNVFKGHNIMLRNLKALELTPEEIQEFINYNDEMRKQYEISYKGYVVVLPHTVEELVKEGNDLNHCVAGYSRRISKRETIVGFLRKETTPDESLYTIEMDGKKVIQAKGNCNEIEKAWK